MVQWCCCVASRLFCSRSSVVSAGVLEGIPSTCDFAKSALWGLKGGYANGTQPAGASSTSSLEAAPRSS